MPQVVVSALDTESEIERLKAVAQLDSVNHERKTQWVHRDTHRVLVLLAELNNMSLWQLLNAVAIELLRGRLLRGLKLS